MNNRRKLDTHPLLMSLLCIALLLTNVSYGGIAPGEDKLLTACASTDSLPSDNFIHYNGGLNNFLFRIHNEKNVTVAFLGGSITYGKGWRDKVMHYLEQAYPETSFTFINAGIPSLGSLPHAFRLQSDVLSHGRIDLLFIESAVNDLANGTPVQTQRRALEGIVRHARREQPSMDIVLMAFADEDKIADFDAGRIPDEVAVHQQVAQHYELPFINLAEEVARRINAGEFTWIGDFKNLHPSPFGHGLYFRTIRRLIELGEGKKSRHIRTRRLPPPIEEFNYANGGYVAVGEATNLSGFKQNKSWTPADGANTREGFVGVPMLVSDKAGSAFNFSFEGTAVGIGVVSGPDAGAIRYTIDGGKPKTLDLFTQWSPALHLPWYLLLADGLAQGEHTLQVTLLESHNVKSTGTACRVVHFLVNK